MNFWQYVLLFILGVQVQVNVDLLFWCIVVWVEDNLFILLCCNVNMGLECYVVVDVCYVVVIKWCLVYCEIVLYEGNDLVWVQFLFDWVFIFWKCDNLNFVQMFVDLVQIVGVWFLLEK